MSLQNYLTLLSKNKHRINVREVASAVVPQVGEPDEVIWIACCWVIISGELRRLPVDQLKSPNYCARGLKCPHHDSSHEKTEL